MLTLTIRRRRICSIVLAACTAFFSTSTAHAANTSFGEIDVKYTLKGSYGAAWRLEDPSGRIIDSPPRPSVPIADELKYPESNNHDDGDRSAC